MKHPKEIIPLNPQTDPCSCVAWATETILLSFEKARPSLQHIPNFHFYEAEQRIQDAGIKAWTTTYGKDFAGFADHVLKAARRGVYPATVIPSHVGFDYQAGEVRIVNRAYLISENNGGLEFYSSLPNGDVLIRSFERFRREYYAWAHILKVSPTLNKDLLLQTLYTRQN